MAREQKLPVPRLIRSEDIMETIGNDTVLRIIYFKVAKRVVHLFKILTAGRKIVTI